VRLLALPLILAAAPLAACVNTDKAIFVSPTISSPTATVTMVTFGTSLTGGFTLDLHLGARAAGPSTVSDPQFKFLDAQANGDVVSPIPVTGDMTFPLTVQPDSDTVVHFTFDTGTKPLPMADGDMMHLCAPAGVVLGGVFNDSLMGSGTQTTVDSAVFNPTCM
jgi:hypothetical protein